MLALIKPSSKDILANLLATEEEKTLFEKLYFDLRAISTQNSLTEFDGIINKENANKIYPSYFSPTALATLFGCPAKYLFSKTAGEEKDIFLRGEIAANRQGSLYHDILKDFYSFIKDKKDFLSISWTETENLFNDFFDKRFSKSRTEKYGLYPLLWEIIKQEMKENLLNFIKEDLKNIQETGFVPNDFECSINATLTIHNKPITLQARADRLDKSANDKEYMAVDYKKKYKTAGMENLIFNENNLQPPIYLEVLNKENNDSVCSKTKLAYIENDKSNPFKSLTLEEYGKIRDKFITLLSFLRDLAEQGIFPIYSEDKDHCNFCDFKDICRKNHLPTLKRVQKSNYFKELKNFHYVPSRPRGQKNSRRK